MGDMQECLARDWEAGGKPGESGILEAKRKVFQKGSF